MKAKKPKIYLAGRMDFNVPFHARWRKEITPFLEKLGFDVLNPYDLEPLQLAGLRPGRLPDGYKHWYEFGDSDNPILQERFKRYMRKIIMYDIGVVKREADIIIVLWDKHCAHGAGTHSELTYALEAGKPVYCVKTAKKMPSWARACTEEIFNNFGELKAFLKKEFAPNEENENISENNQENSSNDLKVTENSSNS